MNQKYVPTTESCTGFQAFVKRIWRKTHHAMLIALMAFIAIGALPVNAELDTVRIGFFNSAKYGYIGADGDLRGYDIHLSKAIGMYGGFHAEMLGYDSVAEMEAALRDGEVDVLIDFVRTEKREQEFIFTNNPIMEEQVSLYTCNDPGALTADSILSVQSLRVGYVSNSGFLDYFMDYCAELGILPRLMDFHDESEMHSALERGETDACMTGSAVPTGYRVLLSSPPLSSYMMLRAEDTALRSRIDAAINQLKTDDPDYMANLYHQYVASHNTEMTPLNAKEREYLSKHSELSVAVVRNAEPFTFENDDGSLGGIIPDYYNTLGERLGVTFHFVAYDKSQEAIDDVASGKVDILGHYYGDIIIAGRDGLYDTMKYGATDCARLVRSGFNGEVKTAAVTERTAYLLAEQLGTDIRLVTYQNIEACYDALMHHKADAMIGSMTGITWLINQHTMRGVSLSILPNVRLGIRGAVSCENPTLLFVLNKAISVSGNVMNEAIIENAVDRKINLRIALENLPLAFTIGIVTVLLTLVVFLIALLVLLARSSRERMALLNREIELDGLTGAGSRRYGTKLLNQELLHSQGNEEAPLLAMMDIDYFKRKNDTYGHEYGDFVLKKVVEILRERLRQTDAIIRWGGDEFLLLFPKIRDKGAEHVLEKVVLAINSAEFLMAGKGEQITVSIGASFFRQEDKDIAEILRRCDSAMYKAKRVRNTYYIYQDEKDSKEEA